MNITIFSGGSGSIEIQNGLYELYEDNICINIIINGYDDGLSTGIVRKIYNDKILGPSDLRKNHLHIHKLKYGETPIYLFLNHRFTSKQPFDYLANKLNDIITRISLEQYTFLYDCIVGFFMNEKANLQEYYNFNTGNIIYAYCFYTFGIEESKELICNMLHINNTVHYQCNYPYRLNAKTQQSKTLDTEESIVNFANYEDKICDVFCLDENNNVCIPDLEHNVIDIINKSDIIIFSCGTLWSSLIPTYKSQGFYDIINSSKSKKYIIYNLQNDKDMYGCSLTDYLHIYNSYLPMEDINIVVANDLNINVDELTDYNVLFCEDILNGHKHNGYILMSQIFVDYFREYLKYNHLIFDYDYTLYDKLQPILSDKLIALSTTLQKHKSILSGNYHKNIIIDSNMISAFENIITDHCMYDYKLCSYFDNNNECSDCVLSTKDKNNIFDILKPTTYNIEDRLYSICISGLNKYREEIYNKIKQHFDKDYRIIKTGRTSIEILKQCVSKYNGYQQIISKSNHIYLYISDIDDIPEIDNKIIIKSMQWLFILLKTFKISELYKKDLFIVAGGVNSRMNYKPKLLMDIGGETLLDYIIEKGHMYVNNIYILTNNIYYDYFDKTKYNILLCKGMYEDLPNGNLETIYSGIKQIQGCSDNILIMWSDCIPNENIFAEMAYCNDDFLIPVCLEKNPYAYLSFDASNNINEIRFQKTHPIDNGLHDMSIFSINKHILLFIMERFFLCPKEKHLFDVITYFAKIKKKINYIETKYPTMSFNTDAEYQECIQHLL